MREGAASLAPHLRAGDVSEPFPQLPACLLGNGASNAPTQRRESPAGDYMLGKGLEKLKKLAGWTGLEPAASGVTGRRYNQLNYHPKHCINLSTRGPGSTPDVLAPFSSEVGGTGFEPAAIGL
jgi:hypothetical protein